MMIGVVKRVLAKYIITKSERDTRTRIRSSNEKTKFLMMMKIKRRHSSKSIKIILKSETKYLETTCGKFQSASLSKNENRVRISRIKINV